MRVLVAVPTLGERPELLRQSLTSIAAQDVEGLDIVAVAPPGRGVEEVVAQFGGRFVDDPGSGGLSGALNAALDAASPGTTYFTWLGDDDLLTPRSLEATIGYLDSHPDAVMAFGWCDYINVDGRIVFRNRIGRLAALTVGFGPNLIPQPGCLMRFHDVLAVGGIDESVRLAMDLDLFLRLRTRGRLASVGRTVSCFRWHDDSATVRSEKVSMDESDQLRTKYLPRPLARAYRLLRWPGRWALWLAKRHVHRKSTLAEPGAAGH